MDGLPVFAVITDALAALSSKWRVFLKALIIPALAISFIERVPTYFSEGFISSFATWALSAPLYVIFAVVCHRVVILGESSLPKNNGLFWSERETRFFGWTIALIIVTWGIGLVIGALALLLPSMIFGASTPWVPLLVVAAIVGYFYVRLSLVFPATATDQRTSLADAMLLSTGNGLRMLAAVVIPVLPLVGVEYLLLELVDDSATILEYLIREVLAYAAMIITICVVSVIYRTLADIEVLES